ncbi:hypothetical protein A3Q56_05025 [Intoshia linei]|uniref:Uncharacterized protein n=1 Tax=Intoshia linei TaxID=1819745 RepID=A0A177AZ08_9BILA|nr:hypothetical protein A3Q56_05025 [Intoshia linei]
MLYLCNARSAISLQAVNLNESLKLLSRFEENVENNNLAYQQLRSLVGPNDYFRVCKLQVDELKRVSNSLLNDKWLKKSYKLDNVRPLLLSNNIKFEIPNGVRAFGTSKMTGKCELLNKHPFFAKNRLHEIQIRHFNFPDYGEDAYPSYRAIELRFSDSFYQSDFDLLCFTGEISPYYNLETMNEFTDIFKAHKLVKITDIKEYMLKRPLHMDSFVGGIRARPSSYCNQIYNTHLFYKIIVEEGVYYAVRFRLIPINSSVTNSGQLEEEEQKNPWKVYEVVNVDLPIRYLDEEYNRRLKNGPITYVLQTAFLRIHGPENIGRTNPSIRWPSNLCRWVDVAVLTINTTIPRKLENTHDFNIINIPNILNFPQGNIENYSILPEIFSSLQNELKKIAFKCIHFPSSLKYRTSSEMRLDDSSLVSDNFKSRQFNSISSKKQISEYGLFDCINTKLKDDCQEYIVNAIFSIPVEKKLFKSIYLSIVGSKTRTNYTNMESACPTKKNNSFVMIFKDIPIGKFECVKFTNTNDMKTFIEYFIISIPKLKVSYRCNNRSGWLTKNKYFWLKYNAESIPNNENSHYLSTVREVDVNNIYHQLLPYLSSGLRHNHDYFNFFNPEQIKIVNLCSNIIDNINSTLSSNGGIRNAFNCIINWFKYSRGSNNVIEEYENYLTQNYYMSVKLKSITEMWNLDSYFLFESGYLYQANVKHMKDLGHYDNLFFGYFYFLKSNESKNIDFEDDESVYEMASKGLTLLHISLKCVTECRENELDTSHSIVSQDIKYEEFIKKTEMIKKQNIYVQMEPLDATESTKTYSKWLMAKIGIRHSQFIYHLLFTVMTHNTFALEPLWIIQKCTLCSHHPIALYFDAFLSYIPIECQIYRMLLKDSSILVKILNLDLENTTRIIYKYTKEYYTEMGNFFETGIWTKLETVPIKLSRHKITKDKVRKNIAIFVETYIRKYYDEDSILMDKELKKFYTMLKNLSINLTKMSYFEVFNQDNEIWTKDDKDSESFTSITLINFLVNLTVQILFDRKYSHEIMSQNVKFSPTMPHRLDFHYFNILCSHKKINAAKFKKFLPSVEQHQDFVKFVDFINLVIDNSNSLIGLNIFFDDFISEKFSLLQDKLDNVWIQQRDL